MVQTVHNLIAEMANEILGLLSDLVLNHSSVQQRWNDSVSGIFIAGPDHKWGQLDIEGHRMQSKVLADYRRYADIMRTLLREQPGNSVRTFDTADKTILAAIVQNGPTWVSTPLEGLEKARNQLHERLKIGNSPE